ncbi:MAG TPA: pyruvate kinase [Terriglobia bacterium]|nr:pyruvate kinase [Terriglobia bacterium]
MIRRTKIVCTIGPASDSEEMISKLISAGMNVARVNFSHGTDEYHCTVIRRLKDIRKAMDKPLAILQDLQGPKIRIGEIASGFVQLMPGQEFILTAEDVPGDAKRASVSLKSLPQEVKAGHSILLADGNIELLVEKVIPPDIVCRVIVGGILSSHKGINLPGSEVNVDSLTSKDRKDILIGLQEGVDAIALSFVRRAGDIDSARKVVTENGGNIPIVAKIEKHEAVENIDSIVMSSNAIMVARGDLGVEIDLERVPLVQKSIIRKCNALGKPVITATQMLQRMVDNPRPTRAEAADVANAILDGTDAVMLSEETAVGKYPVEAVLIMDRIARSAECALDVSKFENIPAAGSDTSDAISRASYFVAKEIGAAAIITPTWSGSTACRVARFRPKQPILATTPNEAALDFLSLCWGVTPIFIPPSANLDEMIRLSIDAARRVGYVVSGQQVVITGGLPLHTAGKTNFIKVDWVD